MIRLMRGTIEATRQPVLVLASPFHPSFPRRAKLIGGRWDGHHWLFDVRDAERVAEICADIYGVDPLNPSNDVTTVQTTILEDESLPEKLWAFGRMLVERRDADDDVWLGDKTIIVAGSFLRSAGSRRAPVIGRPYEAVTLEIRDVPTRLLSRENRPYRIIDRPQDDTPTEDRLQSIIDQVGLLPPSAQAALLLRLRAQGVRDQ